MSGEYEHVRRITYGANDDARPEQDPAVHASPGALGTSTATAKHTTLPAQHHGYDLDLCWARPVGGVALRDWGVGHGAAVSVADHEIEEEDRPFCDEHNRYRPCWDCKDEWADRAYEGWKEGRELEKEGA